VRILNSPAAVCSLRKLRLQQKSENATVFYPIRHGKAATLGSKSEDLPTSLNESFRGKSLKRQTIIDISSNFHYFSTESYFVNVKIVNGK
jgi:hypothetical protein